MEEGNSSQSNLSATQSQERYRKNTGVYEFRTEERKGGGTPENHPTEGRRSTRQPIETEEERHGDFWPAEDFSDKLCGTKNMQGKHRREFSEKRKKCHAAAGHTKANYQARVSALRRPKGGTERSTTGSQAAGDKGGELGIQSHC